MNHGLRLPPGPVIEVAVFREAAEIQHAHRRADAGVVEGAGLTPIVKARPGEATGEILPFRIDRPPAFRAHRVTGIVRVIPCGMGVLRIFLVHPARRPNACRLGSDGRQGRKLAMKRVQVLPGVLAATAARTRVVEALHIHNVGSAAPPSAVHCGGDGPGRVQTPGRPLHGGHDVRPDLRALVRLLICQRPQDDAGMVAIPLHQTLQLAQALRGRRHHPCLVHNQHPRSIAGVQKLRRGRVMRCAAGIGAARLQQGNAIVLQLVR